MSVSKQRKVGLSKITEGFVEYVKRLEFDLQYLFAVLAGEHRAKHSCAIELWNWEAF